MSARTRAAASLRRQIVQAAERLEYWLTEAQHLDEAGRPGAAICIRYAARTPTVEKAFAAARELRELRS